MSTERQMVSVRDLVEEAKKRIVFLIVCVVGLSYLMSLTSPSVLVNLPVAAVLIIIFRYWSVEYDMRKKAETYKGKPITASTAPKRNPFEVPRVTADKSDWKHKVDSPVVEDAIDHFTRHIVSEWVTDLWYSRITPDRQGPEELVLIMNGVLGELSYRMRDINLINLLTRDIVDILCTQLELFRTSKTKIEKHQFRFRTNEEREMELKSVLAAENKLHPALFSAKSEHKVLQHITDGLISFTFKPEDLQCSLFRYVVRELLACAVMRPVLNLSNPRFINERIESLIISLSKTNKGSKATHVDLQSRTNVSPNLSSDHFSRVLDPSMKGVELVQLKKDQSRSEAENPASGNMKETLLSKDPLLSFDTHSTHSWSSLSETNYAEGRGIQRQLSGGEWVDMLDVFSRRKTEALAPEHFDNMWTKGRNYKRKEGVNQVADPVKQGSLVCVSNSVEQSKVLSGQKKKVLETIGSSFESDVLTSGCNKCPGPDNIVTHDDFKKQSRTANSLNEDKDEHNVLHSDEVKSESSSYNTEDEDTSSVTGIDSPGIKVWDAKNKRSIGRIHHPLESFEGHKSRKANKGHLRSQRLHKTQSKRKRSRSSSQNGHIWQEVERTSFLLGDRQDILNSSIENIKHEDSSDDFKAELLGRVYSGATTSSSVSLASLPGSHCLPANSAKKSIVADSFFKLRCEVLGANIVKSGSKTFAVYSISVTDVNSNSWSIKRRFRHFEELHRRLKEFPEYNLHLPPKHFLSTGVDVFVIQERCKLLDQYLKKLLQLPTVSSSIEVWDFLSVDSQTYVFSNSLSILETLSVDLDDTIPEKSRDYRDRIRPTTDLLFNQKENFSHGKESALRMKGEHVTDASKLNKRSLVLSPRRKPTKGCGKALEDSSSDSDNPEQESIHLARNLGKTLKTDANGSRASEFINAATDPTLPSEWVPPNLSVPILDLVDVIFQLQDGGWIRRKAFWVAKQILQLGMGDAFDDWLIEKIQILRRGSVVASGIRRLEQILWPDGIFVTKHPKRQQPTCVSPSHNSSRVQSPTPFSSPKIDGIQELEEMQQKEAERRAKLVYELMIDKAPAAIVGLVGHKEYEKCAKDLYYFIQSSVCMKQLAFYLLELLLLSAFPELDYVFKQLHEEKDKFGKLELNSQS
ncbi:Phox-associated domain [Forsythia ovata]|uniref:Phox-associated domain n=1 Tax=Forsythia ovata TaxID=205694 RepID=A0ABD1PFI8_9LAMI